jgi:hypothetical protein
MVNKLHLDTYASQDLRAMGKNENKPFHVRVLYCLERLHKELEQLDERLTKIEEENKD